MMTFTVHIQAFAVMDIPPVAKKNGETKKIDDNGNENDDNGDDDSNNDDGNTAKNRKAMPKLSKSISNRSNHFENSSTT